MPFAFFINSNHSSWEIENGNVRVEEQAGSNLAYLSLAACHKPPEKDRNKLKLSTPIYIFKDGVAFLTDGLVLMMECIENINF